MLAVLFDAANAYLGVQIGLTISASIPAAVISMRIIRVVMKRDSILENNMVQTIGSAGESIAGGAIFTFPVFIGGLIRNFFDKKGEDGKAITEKGILYTSGLIAGEGLIGVLLAIFALIRLSNGKTLLKTINMGNVLGMPGSVVFKRPRISHISLDRYGSTLWLAVDGKASVNDILHKMQETFPDESKDMLNRVVHFLNTLEIHKFIART